MEKDVPTNCYWYHNADQKLFRFDTMHVYDGWTAGWMNGQNSQWKTALNYS